MNFEKGEIKDTCSKNEVEYLYKIKEKMASKQTAHSMSVVNYNDGCIISLNDFVNNLDPNDIVLNERIFIIVYFYSLKYFKLVLHFNEHNLYFSKDSTFPWGFGLEGFEQNMNSTNFNHTGINESKPAIFRFIYNSIYNLNYPFLNNFKDIISIFLNSQTRDQEFMVKMTRQLLEKHESYQRDFNKIFYEKV